MNAQVKTVLVILAVCIVFHLANKLFLDKHVWSKITSNFEDYYEEE